MLNAKFAIPNSNASVVMQKESNKDAYHNQVKYRAEMRQEFTQKLMSHLSAHYPGQHIHVWLKSGVYLGLYVWSLTFHWKWGYSGQDVTPFLNAPIAYVSYKEIMSK